MVKEYNNKALLIVNEAIEELSKDIANGKSERYVEYLEFRVKFHNYSWNNAILISIQRPDAEFLKGFNQWKEMGYYVKAGAVGIAILAPIYKKFAEIDGKIVYWSDMSKAQRETAVFQKSSGFKTVYVFDIKDTDCKEYPTFFYQLGNSYEEIYKIHLDLFRKTGIDIIESEISDGSQGYYTPGTKEIHIKQDNEYNNKLLTLIHELGHLYCHQIENYNKNYNYNDGELHAESIAFIIARHLGLDHPFASDYIQGWGGDVKKLKANMEVISKVTGEMMDIIDQATLVKDEKAA